MLQSPGCRGGRHGTCIAIVTVQGPNALFCECPCHLERNVARLRQLLAERRVVAELEGTTPPSADSVASVPAVAESAGEDLEAAVSTAYHEMGAA
jgi:hypothetical protein